MIAGWSSRDHFLLFKDIDECASGAICLGMYEVCVNTPGHYKCECARFFRRDPVTGQCQPDPAIYSQYAPQKSAQKKEDGEKKEEEEKKEDGKRYCFDEKDCHDQEDHDRYLEAMEKKKSSDSSERSTSSITTSTNTKTDDDDELSEDDIKRLVIGFVICVIGTAAAKGSIFWNTMFFLSLILTGLWWASDKTEEITRSLMRNRGGQRAHL